MPQVPKARLQRSTTSKGWLGETLDSLRLSDVYQIGFVTEIQAEWS
jgi:hypothetical protein